MDDEKSAPKPPPHPPIQAIHPGRRNSRAHKMETPEQRHARVMRRSAEPLHLAKPALTPHQPKG